MPRASPQNYLLLIAVFNDGHGKRWPWEVRAESIASAPQRRWFFELETDKPGQPVYLRRTGPRDGPDEERQGGRARQGAAHTRPATSRRRSVAAGLRAVHGREEMGSVTVVLPQDSRRRGTFLVSGRRWTAGSAAKRRFVRIPDLAAVTGGKPTLLGLHRRATAAPHLGYRHGERPLRRAPAGAD